jgi:hypothetical protein
MFGGNIDWSATGDMLQGWGSILGALAIIVAAWFGSQTFKAWRQQNVAERKAVQAERILTAAYTARRQLAYVRNIGMWEPELSKARKTLIDAGEIKADDKLNAAREVREDLEACLPMARALFGHDVEQALEAMNHHFHTVQVYVDADLRDKDGSDRDFRHKIESTIWAGYSETGENELDLKIEANVALIEEKCLPALRLDP